MLFGVTSWFNYGLLCGTLLLPLAAATWAYAVSRWAQRQLEREWEARRSAVDDRLPAGVSWEFPPHQPGDCSGPESDEGVED